MKKHSLLALTIVLLIFGFHMAQNVSAAELLTNGGFETGNFSGWTITNASGGWQSWQNVPAGTDLCPGCSSPPTNPAPTSPQQGTRDVVNGVTANANSQYEMYQQITLPAGQTASLSWKDRFQMNLFDFCTSAAACGQAFYVVDITNTSGTVLQTLYSATAPPLTKTDTGWRTHGFNFGTTYAGQTIRIRFRSWATVTFAGPGQAEIDAVSFQSPAVPTAATASLSGRIRTTDGTGIGKAVVSLTDSQGNTRTALTNAFGYYRFDEIPLGTTIVSVASKRYGFAEPTRIITIQDNVSDVDWTAIE